MQPKGLSTRKKAVFLHFSMLMDSLILFMTFINCSFLGDLKLSVAELKCFLCDVVCPFQPFGASEADCVLHHVLTPHKKNVFSRLSMPQLTYQLEGYGTAWNPKVLGDCGCS